MRYCLTFAFFHSSTEHPLKALLSDSPYPIREGQNLSLTCNSSQTSVPEANQTDVHVKYSWTRNDQHLDPGDLPGRHAFKGSNHHQLQVSNVHRTDNGSSYACFGQEDGSDLASLLSDEYNVDVQC